ncbi:response regulator transcription factor [Cellulomonas cellasea]|uniref:DNA-binding NarL/FixJ family response regulator n=1 Tax=Cellulomonas cellasea TaxID=43670 RepID=A0A7W4UDJ8_9CELL|nr:response regulator transcription factor [Cellulomonas cellasea]MBB2921680.1 DNA-binding NarL/FixJ family response regulator [Cellulomonas cellasea]
MIQVFVLDDHEIVRQGLLRLIDQQADMRVVGEARSAAEALVRAPLLDVDVAVLDVRLPDGNGIEVCRELRSQRPGLACLMLTSFADDEALLAAVTAGAAGYVLKEIRGTALLDAVRAVAAGRTLIDAATRRHAVERVRAEQQHDARLERLSTRERAALELVGEGLTNRQIAQHLGLAEKTVKNYVSSILAKIEVQGRTQAALYIAEEHRAHPDR